MYIYVCNILLYIDSTSAFGKGKRTSHEMLYEWMSRLPLRCGNFINTVCEGEVRNNSFDVRDVDTKYCDIHILGKEMNDTNHHMHDDMHDDDCNRYRSNSWSTFEVVELAVVIAIICTISNEFI